MLDQAFATPIFVFDPPAAMALVDELGAVLRAEAASDPGVTVSNRGGWHSLPDLALRDGPVFRALADLFVEHFRYATEHTARRAGAHEVPAFGLMYTAWAMVMGKGAYTVAHDHPEATWSSAFYVDAGDAPPEAPESGHLTFIDPRRGAASIVGLDLFPTSTSVVPVTGRLVIFPGYLQHYVHPYVGERERICVAANATLRVSGPAPVEASVQRGIRKVVRR